MGLDMRKILLAGLAGLVLNGCVKMPNMDDDEVPATPAAVLDSVAAAWGEADPLSMEKGNFILNHTYRTIDNGEPRLTLEEGATIFDKIERAEDFKYIFLYQTRYKDSLGQDKISTTEAEKYVGKEPEITNSAEQHILEAAEKISKQSLQPSDLNTLSADYKLMLGFENLVNLAYACELSEAQQKFCREQLKYDSCEVKCFNLKQYNEVLPKPDYLKKVSPCADINNCTTTYETVSFDWAVYYKKGANTEKQKINYSITTNKELPFLARVTNYCYRTLVSVETQSVPVRFCTTLENYIPAATQSAF